MNVYRVAWVAKSGEMCRITHIYADSAQDAADRLRSTYKVFSIIYIFQRVTKLYKKLDWK
jgi:hypothetical protein